MKKLLHGIFVAILFVALAGTLVACGKKATVEPDDETTATESAESTEAIDFKAEDSTEEEVETETAEAEASEPIKVYFAGPLFSQSEKDYNLMLTELLEKHGYKVFLPQRDGIEAALLEGKTEEEKTEMIFEKDFNEIMKADVLVMVVDGRVPDEGACVELGIAYQAGKRCYGVRTDTRAVELDLEVNPMLTGCFTKLFHDYDGEALVASLEEYLAENTL